MNKIKLLTLNWWLLHIAAIAFFLFLGHVVRF
jgi:hypothetical protein